MPNTVHAAFKVNDKYHITIFYRDCCSYDVIAKVERHLSKLPSGRKLLIDSVAHFDNPQDPNNPLLVLKVSILTADGKEIDHDLMTKIAEFSNRHSWRADIDQQYKYSMHVTLGPASQLQSNFLETIGDLYIGKKYYKLHQTGEKVWIE